MPLDLDIKYESKMLHFEISEALHQSIFANSIRWSSYKYLRKIKDYYRADCLLRKNDAISFINELLKISELHNLSIGTLEELKTSVVLNKIEYIRVSSD
ncbi:hypothetical protein ABIC80_003374 [Kosakonia sp. 1610]|mgnify:FL=1